MYGQALKITETDIYRDGGFTLPRPKGGFGAVADLGSGFTFKCKAAVNDLLEVRFVLTNGRSVEYTFGSASHVSNSNPIPADGTWQNVFVPIESLKGLGNVLDRIELRVPENFKGSSGPQAGSSVWRFANFSFGAAPVEAPINPTLATLKSFGTGDDRASTPEIVKLAASRDPFIRYNAIKALSRAKLSAIPVELSDAVNDFNVAISEAALRCIAIQKLPEGTQLLKKAARICPTDYGKVVAIGLLEELKDPAMVIEFAGLTASDSRSVREAAVHALGGFTTDAAKRFRVGASIQDDPAIRLASITNASADEEDYIRRKLLYLALNDPSDAVRIASGIQLLKSKDTPTRQEGLKGIRDDSAWVRLSMVSQLGDYVPVDEARVALQSAVIDPVPSIRAAAATRLGKMGEVSTAEIQNLMTDDHPAVVAALIDLVQLSKLKVGSDVISRWKAHPDPMIRTRAAALK